MRTALKRLTGLLAALAIGGAWAQTAPFPNKPIKMYVGFSAGSATDIVARVVAKGLGDRLGQAVVVENRTGAGGSLAARSRGARRARRLHAPHGVERDRGHRRCTPSSRST
jgi:tripartite-type tricarboxylate transporter receptor subunit TctC